MALEIRTAVFRPRKPDVIRTVEVSVADTDNYMEPLKINGIEVRRVEFQRIDKVEIDVPINANANEIQAKIESATNVLKEKYKIE